MSLQNSDANLSIRSEQSSYNPDARNLHYPLPAWFRNYFPLMTSNEFFRQFYDFMLHVYIVITSSFPVRPLLVLLSIVLAFFSPAIAIWKAVTWLTVKIFFLPCFRLFIVFISMVGILGVINSVFERVIGIMDYYGDAVFSIMGNCYTYIFKKWNEITGDIETALEKLYGLVEEMLVTIIKTMKSIYKYWADLLKFIFPNETALWMSYWLGCAAYLIKKSYTLTKMWMVKIDEMLLTIYNAWKNEDPSSPHTDLLSSAAQSSKQPASTALKNETLIPAAVKSAAEVKDLKTN